MKLIDPCSQCFTMPMCRKICVDKGIYSQSIRRRKERLELWKNFFITMAIMGIVVGFFIVLVVILRKVA